MLLGFTEFLYGPLKRSRMDLETVTIERGRDAGLASFNNARVAYNLEPIRDFSQLNPDLPLDVSLLIHDWFFVFSKLIFILHPFFPFLLIST